MKDFVGRNCICSSLQQPIEVMRLQGLTIDLVDKIRKGCTLVVELVVELPLRIRITIDMSDGRIMKTKLINVVLR